jgi:hypothetical protein
VHHKVAILDDLPIQSTRPGVLETAISGFIAVVLGCQFIVGFTYHGGHGFPILSYPMFSKAHYEGERLNDLLVYASVDGGPETVFDPEALELSYPLYQKTVALPLTRGERRDLVLGLVARLCAGQPGATVVKMTVADSGYYIAREGPVDVGRQVQGALDFACPGV